MTIDVIEIDMAHSSMHDSIAVPPLPVPLCVFLCVYTCVHVCVGVNVCVHDDCTCVCAQVGVSL